MVTNEVSSTGTDLLSPIARSTVGMQSGLGCTCRVVLQFNDPSLTIRPEHFSTHSKFRVPEHLESSTLRSNGRTVSCSANPIAQ
jgi:hypothetical protein